MSRKQQQKRTISVKELRFGVLSNPLLGHLTNNDCALIVGLAEAYIDGVNVARSVEAKRGAK